MIVNVVEAEYIDSFKIRLSLSVNNNESIDLLEKEVDLYNYIQSKKDKGIFASLRKMENFKKFKINANTIEWENGADIAPERFLEI
jgi:hypothetical protein